MAVSVEIPTLLRPLTQDQKRVETTGNSVLEVIEAMDADYPGMKDRLMANGEAHSFINIYVNDNDIRFTDGLATAINDGDTVTILPAVAGG